jgi:hypothetical protein
MALDHGVSDEDELAAFYFRLSGGSGPLDQAYQSLIQSLEKVYLMTQNLPSHIPKPHHTYLSDFSLVLDVLRYRNFFLTMTFTHVINAYFSNNPQKKRGYDNLA